MVVPWQGPARVYELREELKVFPTNERSDYTELLASDEGCAKPASRHLD